MNSPRTGNRRIILSRFPQPFHAFETVIPDLGLGYVAKAARGAGFDPVILDPQINGVSRDRWAEWIAGQIQPREKIVVGVKIFSMDEAAAARALEDLKSLRSDIALVGGGPHPTGVREEIFERIPALDFAFAGESDLGFPKFLKALNGEGDFTDVEGLIFKQGGKVKVNEMGRIENLDELDQPAWDLLEIPKFVPSMKSGLSYIALMATRGCPNTCRYCSVRAINGPGMRMRTPALVVDEICFLNRHYGINSFSFVDDNLTYNKEYFNEFLDELGARKLEINWNICTNGVRAETLTGDMLAKMKNTGCKGLSVAVESGSPRVLNDMGRTLSLESVSSAVKRVRAVRGLKLFAFFILGFPTEKREDILKTIRFARTMDVDEIFFFLFSPFPGTPIYKELKDKGRLENVKPEDLRLDRPSIPLEDVTLEELKRWQVRAFWKFYFRPRMIARMAWRMIRSPWRLGMIFRKGLRLLPRKNRVSSFIDDHKPGM